MLCYYLHLLLMNTMLYVTHTLLIMYFVLFSFNVKTKCWGEISSYSKCHIISKYSAHHGSYGQSQGAHSRCSDFSPDRSSCRQVAMVRFSFNAPTLPVSTLPPTLRINALLCILFAVKSHRFTPYFKETFLYVNIKKDSDELGREGGLSCSESADLVQHIM
jgi:hypothetical protein